MNGLAKENKEKKNVFKDHTFSGLDLIRFFLNNLEENEIYQVYDFFHAEDIENLFEMEFKEIESLLFRYYDFMQDVLRMFGYIQTLQFHLAFFEYIRLVKVQKQLVIDTLDKFPFFRKLARRPPK